MNTRRVSSPPQLPGFEFIELIGSGGYADVFLYQQNAPRRLVAIKVVDDGALDSRTAVDYTEEANVMAMVSAHPNIVQVFQASVSPDGRPFLVMEYYPNQNFQERSRNEQMSVAEVLRVGIQIASAVETAHRAGILHRDIKPANILTSEFNHPGLADFGIAAVAGQSDTSGDGLSIPWSPPEALGEAPTLRQSDVYSLAATIYTMLAGRAPFEIKGGDNRPLAMMTRIEREPVPPTGRADVPRLLEQVFVRAMSKDPAARPATAADLARQLQEVESSMQLPVTPLQLRDNGPVARSRVGNHDDHDATRVKKVTSVAAQQPTATGPSSRLISPVQATAHTSARTGTQPDLRTAAPSGVPTFVRPQAATSTAPTPASISPDIAMLEAGQTSSISPVEESEPRGRARRGLLDEPDVGDTIQRPQLDPVEPADYEPPRSVPKSWWILAAVAVAIIMVVGLTQLLGGNNPPPPSPADEATATVVESLAPQVIGVSAAAPLPLSVITGEVVAEGSNKFTWAVPDAGVTFTVTEVIDGNTSTREIVENEFTTASKCIDVQVVAPSGLMSPPTRGCVS